MMTRWLTPSQFGLWEYIIDVIAFAAYPTGIITYWATREVARGKPVARTALLTSQLTSVVGVGVYLLLAFLSYREVGSALGPFLLSIALVPLAYWTQSSASLVSGYDPAISGYSLFLSEPAKLAGTIQGITDFKQAGVGYIAPTQAGKSHRYQFTLYVLDAKLGLQPGLDKASLMFLLQGHIIAKGELIVTCGK